LKRLLDYRCTTIEAIFMCFIY